MPNWCINNVIFFSEEEQNVLDFERFLITSTKAPEGENEDTRWFGRVASSLDIPVESIYCRGFITWGLSELDNLQISHDRFNQYGDVYYFEIETEMAWDPDTEFWCTILDAYNARNESDIRFVNVSEECGMGIYEKTDILEGFFMERFSIWVHYDDEYYELESTNCDSQSDLAIALNDYLACNKLDLRISPNLEYASMENKVNDYFAEHDISGDCCIHKYRMVEI